MNNCAQFKGVSKLKCDDYEYEHFRDTSKFDAKEFRKFIKREYEFKDSPFVYKEINSKKNGFHLKPHQRFVGKYINHHNNHNGILLYHGLGSGKSLTSIIAGICHISYYKNRQVPKIMVITPANLIENYKLELQSLGPEQVLVNGEKHTYRNKNGKHIKPSRFFIGNKQNKFIANQSIDKYWKIMTHQKFINGIFDSKTLLPGSLIDKLKEPGRVFIIDEAHNLVSDVGENYKKILNAFKNYLHPTSKLILLTATPIVDSAHEIGLLLNLLNPRIYFPESRKEFEKLSSDQLKYMMYGYVSYFAGGDPSMYPTKSVELVYHKFIKNSPQYNNYLKVYEKELPPSKRGNVKAEFKSGFFMKSIMAANIYKNKRVLEQMKKSSNKFEFFRQGMSVKYANIAERINSCNGTVFVYSPYLDMGVDSIALALRLLGFKNYFSSSQGPKYVIWSGRIKEKEEFSRDVLGVFNDESNIDGSKIKVILATRSVAEGVTFKNVRHLHICSHFWNENIIKQAIGRCDRVNSHAALPVGQRTLKVYRHLMVLPTFGSIRFSSSNRSSQNGVNFLKEFSVEEYVDMIAVQKSEKNKNMEKILRQAAVDCNMNKFGNKNRHYKFKSADPMGTFTTVRKDNATGEIINMSRSRSSTGIQNTVCVVNNADIPTKLKETTRNAKLGRKLLFGLMHSNMTNKDVREINKVKKQLIEHIRNEFKNGVPKSKMPKSLVTKKIVKEFLTKSKSNKKVDVVYNQLVGKKTINSDADVALIAELKEYIALKKL